MGLIAFLKRKFGKHSAEEEKELVQEKIQQRETEQKQKAEEIQNEIDKPIVVYGDFGQVVKNPTEEELKQSEEKALKERPKPIELKSHEQIEKEVESELQQTKSDVDKYVAGLDKSRIGFTEQLNKLAKSHRKVTDEYLDELEAILFQADVSYDVIVDVLKEISQNVKEKDIPPDEVNDILIDKLFIGYANFGKSFSTDLNFAETGPTVVFVCGVNGSGKTTSIAKLAYKYKQRGKKILLVAADTFRAGAVEQLEIWAQRISVDILSKPNSDPASLCYDALKKAVDEKYDLVFVDTAGRLQNKKALMDELSKMVRVMKKVIPEAPHESLLVIDANTGQNGIIQAMVFLSSAPLTGLVVTKMDGTSKGGIILSIRQRIGLPVKFIGLGEKMEDLAEFDLEKYLYGLLVGKEESK